MEEKNIGYNKLQVFGKIFVIILISLMIILISVSKIQKSETPPSLFIMLFFPFLAALLLFMYLMIILELLFLAKEVVINYNNKRLTLNYFLNPSVEIEISEILEYATTKVATKSTTYDGIVIYLKNGKYYLLSDFNLAGYLPIKKFLETQEIKFMGHKKISMVLYFFRKIYTKKG